MWDRPGIGGCLHDFYTGVEKVFTLVSPDVNGEALAGDHWHRELLRGELDGFLGFLDLVVEQG